MRWDSYSNYLVHLGCHYDDCNGQPKNDRQHKDRNRHSFSTLRTELGMARIERVFRLPKMEHSSLKNSARLNFCGATCPSSTSNPVELPLREVEWTYRPALPALAEGRRAVQSEIIVRC
jgi:hypothetical protein